MSTSLPPVGTHALLERLSDYVPDDFIAELCPRAFTGGRRHELSAPQLWRVHLLAGLTSTHSLNLLVAQLAEQPVWRRFARLRGQRPTARMLHEFRQQAGVSGLRQINRHLLGRLLHRQGVQPHAVALMDATDLPASCGGFKKKFRRLHRRACSAGWTHAQDRTEPLVCRLQEAHAAAVVAHGAPLRHAVAVGQLGDARQCGGRRSALAQFAVVSSSPGLVARDRRGGHGLFVCRKQSRRPDRLANGGGHQTARRHETRTTLCERNTGGMPARPTARMVGTRGANRATVVSGADTGGILSALLARLGLSATLWLSRRPARNLVWPDPAGQPCGGPFTATSPTLDRTRTVL